MKFTPKQEFLALGVRGARRKRDLLARKGKLQHFDDPTKSSYFVAVSNQDDVVQSLLLQFKNSLRVKKAVDEVEYVEV